MDYTTLKNRVFSNYYFNSYLPGTIGGYESSTIFNYLMSLESVQDNLETEIDTSKKWITDEATWYTSQLPYLFFVPKYNDETDEDYLSRLLLLTGIEQNEQTIINATYSVVFNGIDSVDNIEIINRLDGVSAVWSDSGGYDYWSSTSDPVVWSAGEDITRVIFLVSIDFVDRGSNLLPQNYDYWILPENYTKIEDMIKLYKPPGSTFELRLNIPQDYEQEIEVFSNTLLQWEGIHVVSDTTIQWKGVHVVSDTTIA